MQENKITLSVLMAVYNVKNYIHRCLDSIVNQITDNCELIIIDDGSTDNSGEICEIYAKKYDRIIVKHKKNGGLSSARNEGLKLAKGEYVTFIDSDDYVDENFVKNIIKLTESKEDLIFFQAVTDDNDDLNKIYNNSNNKIINNLTVDQLIKANFLSRELIKNHKYNFRSSWGKVINRNFLVKNKLLFSEDAKMGQDMIFNLNVYSCIKNFKIANDILYHNYFYNEFSITNKYKPNLKEIVDLQDKSIEKWVNENKNNYDYSPYHAFYRLNDIILFLKYDFFHKKNNENKKEKKERFKKIMVDGVYKEYYNEVAKNKLFRYYKLSKRIVMWLSIHNYYNLVELIAHIKYKK